MGLKEKLNAFPVQCFLSFLLWSISCIAVDSITITSTQYLRDGETITSEDGSFTLGFFSPGISKNRYVGIWFAKITQQTVVWVANRENPLQDSSGVFKIGDDGNLAVLDGNERLLWSSNGVSTSNYSVGELLDTGNLILRARDDNNSNNILWQSFDHPSDSFVAAMKFGLNLKTGGNQLLTSWKNSTCPAPGNFSLGFDPNGVVQVIIWDASSRRHWRSGQWNGQLFTGVPEMTSFELYGFNIINDKDEGRLYGTYTSSDKSIISNFVLDMDGKLELSYWNSNNMGWDVVWSQPSNECDIYGKCGPNGSCNREDRPICSCLPGFIPFLPGEWHSGNWSGGCVRKTQLDCKENSGSRPKDGFMKLSGMKLPDYSKQVPLESLLDCERRCRMNCSCNAFTYEIGLGCLTWDGDFNDIQKFPKGGQDLYIRLSKSDLKGHKKVKLVVLLIIIALAVILVLLSSSLLWRRIRREQVPRKKEDSEELPFADLGKQNHSKRHYLDETEFEGGFNEVKNPDLLFVKLDVVRVATDDFSMANKLGEGGFGPVYKGKLPNGQVIAVKRLSAESVQGLEEFENEVKLIAKLQHRNLVRLFGGCTQGEERLLIYDYMPNSSLDTFLFDPTKRALLDWRKRFDIIEGVARGLLYLHRDSPLRLIHRDLKTSNILLDGEMIPKISDFGMARIFGGNQNEENTMTVVGTYGYMAPEYVMQGLFSVKSDVFSFGVVVLEIVTGKRNSSFFRPGKTTNLLGYVWELWKENKMLDLIHLMDPSLQNSKYSTLEVLRCIHIGLLCVQEIATDRPTMDLVVLMLGSKAAILPKPKQPAFSKRGPLQITISQESLSQACSSDLGTSIWSEDEFKVSIDT